MYKTKYYYNIDKWVVVDVLKTDGKDRSPEFAIVEETDTRRKGNSYTEYYIDALDESKYNAKEETYSCDKEIWEKLEVGDKRVVKVSQGTIVEIVEGK